jgi:hypothetical protein
MSYTLHVHSVPTGIEMSVKTPTESIWVVTDKDLTLEAGIEVTVTAPNVIGEPIGTTEKGFKLVKLEYNSSDVYPERSVTFTLNSNITVLATYEQQVYYPVRHYERRATKFEKKTDEEVAKLRVSALKTMMVDQQTVTTAQQGRIENLVGDYLHKQDLYGTQIHHYRNFSQELYGLSRLFTGVVLNKEASLKAQKWVTRLTADGQVEATVKQHLQAIANIFNITLTYT